MTSIISVGMSSLTLMELEYGVLIPTLYPSLAKIFPLLILPCLAAWMVRYMMPKFHRWLVSYPDIPFYLWSVGLALAVAVTTRTIANSDMAIGLGKVFGFNFIENFNHPYMSKSVAEFWRRWHMSLGSWFRDYVYIPLGGNRVSRGRWLFNTLVVWMLTGLWHGASWNFVLWGLLFAGMLLLEKWVLKLDKTPDFLRHVYVLLTVCLSFVLFNAVDMKQAASDFAGLFGLAGLPLTSRETVYYLKSYAFLFVLGFIGATPLVKTALNKVEKTGFMAVLEPVAVLALLLLCTAYLVDGSYNPFLYFRF